MDLLTALANHWILVLVCILAALGATVRGMVRLMAGSMRTAEPTVTAKAAAASATQSQLEASVPAGSGDAIATGITPHLADDPENWTSPPSRTEPIIPKLVGWCKRRFTSQPAAGDLEATVAAAFQYLSGRVPEQAGQIPLYLLTGPAQAGKSTLLAHTRLPWRWRQNLRTFGAANGVQWAFSEQGVLIEVPSEDPGGDHEGADDLAPVWRQLPRLLLRHRPRRPLDGIVLLLPADLLLGDSSQAGARRNELKRLAAAIHRTAGALAMHLPLYVIVSQCDRIPGFARLCAEIPAHKRSDCLGWSNPHSASADGQADILEEACRELRQLFLRLTAEAALHQDLYQPAIAEAAWLPWMELDHQLPRLLEALRLELAALLHRASAAPLFLRGIYWIGDVGDDASPSAAAGGTGPASSGLETRPARQIPRRPGFAASLFLQRIFPERGLATPAGLAALFRQPRALAMQLTAAALLLGLGLGAATQARRLAQWRDQQVLPMLRAAEASQPLPPVQELQAMVRAGQHPFRAWLLPASLFSHVNADLQQNLRQTLESRVYPAMALNLQQQARQLAQRWVAIASNPPTSEGTRTITRPDQLAEFTLLRRFSRDWLQLQDAIDAYQGLAHADPAPSPAEAQRMLSRLGAAPAQPLSASSPVYRAILSAHGPAFVVSRAEQNQASQVMRELVRRLFYRWFMGNALAMDLQRWNRLPGDASGNRARVEIARRLRQELTDPALTPVLHDATRPAGSLYPITLGLVHRSSYLDPGLRSFIQNEATGDLQQVRSLAQQLRTPAGSALIAFKDGHWRLTATPR